MRRNYILRLLELLEDDRRKQEAKVILDAKCAIAAVCIAVWIRGIIRWNEWRMEQHTKALQDEFNERTKP